MKLKSIIIEGTRRGNLLKNIVSGETLIASWNIFIYFNYIIIYTIIDFSNKITLQYNLLTDK